MTESTKHVEIELNESDLTSQSLKKFKISATIGFLIGAILGIYVLFDMGPFWFVLVFLLIGLIAFWVCAVTGISKLSQADEGVGDEWQQSVAQKARSDSYNISQRLVTIAIVSLMVADIFRINLDLGLNLYELLTLLTAIQLMMVFLPKLILSYSIQPSDNS